VWAQRAAAQKPSAAVAPKAAKREQNVPAAGAAATPVAQERHVAVNKFNDGEVRQMMGRGEAGSVYKVDMAPVKDGEFLRSLEATRDH
jgi:predicted regulator of Ras-like GTPase activity (Roadblock/LC7/MglB family)